MEKYEKIAEFWDTDQNIPANANAEREYNLWKKFAETCDLEEEYGENIEFTLKDFELYIKSLGYNEEIEELEEGSKLYAREVEEVGFLINTKDDWQDLYSRETDWKNKKEYKNFIEVTPFDRTDMLDEMLEELMDAGIVIQEGPTQDLYIDVNYLQKQKNREEKDERTQTKIYDKGSCDD